MIQNSESQLGDIKKSLRHPCITQVAFLEATTLLPFVYYASEDIL